MLLPMSIRWHALFDQERPLAVVDAACTRLTDSRQFNDQNEAHVLAVLSPRLCIEINLGAIELATRSVAQHMRLLSSMSPDHRAFSTFSPSEPILVQAAAEILHCEDKPWGPVLDTFSNGLCKPGLVEVGLVGELGARTLLVIARDFTAPKTASGGLPDLLQPVLLLEFLDNLFGNKKWCSQHRDSFERAFGNAFINFTHWIITKDALPDILER
jgi:hypothetical protein